MRKPIVWGQPVSLAIETSSVCNLQCTGCERGQNLISRKQSFLSFEQFRTLLDTMPSTVMHLLLHGQGEPLLNRELPQMIAYANTKKCFTTFSTNGLLLHFELCRQLIDAHLNAITISIDGFDQQSYNAFRVGGSFHDVLQNVIKFVKLKKSLRTVYPIITIQLIVTRFNEYHLKQIKRFAYSTGADIVRFKTAYATDLNSFPSYLPENPKYNRYIVSDGKLMMRRQSAPGCFRFHRSLTITSDGKVVPCCYDKHATYVLGDINTQHIAVIWKSKEVSKLRKQLFTRNKLDMCQNCIE